MALGGFLVGELKFTVPEARQILEDLGPWMKRAGHMRLRTNGDPLQAFSDPVSRELIYVRPKSGDGGGFLYWKRSLGAPSGGRGLANDLDETEFFSRPGVRLINLGGFIIRLYKNL